MHGGARNRLPASGLMDSLCCGKGKIGERKPAAGSGSRDSGSSSPALQVKGCGFGIWDSECAPAAWMASASSVCVRVCVYGWLCVCVCVCVCEAGRERERDQRLGWPRQPSCQRALRPPCCTIFQKSFHPAMQKSIRPARQESIHPVRQKSIHPARQQFSAVFSSSFTLHGSVFQKSIQPAWRQFSNITSPCRAALFKGQFTLHGSICQKSIHPARQQFSKVKHVTSNVPTATAYPFSQSGLAESNAPSMLIHARTPCQCRSGALSLALSVNHSQSVSRWLAFARALSPPCTLECTLYCPPPAQYCFHYSPSRDQTVKNLGFRV